MEQSLLAICSHCVSCWHWLMNNDSNSGSEDGPKKGNIIVVASVTTAPILAVPPIIPQQSS